MPEILNCFFGAVVRSWGFVPFTVIDRRSGGKIFDSVFQPQKVTLCLIVANVLIATAREKTRICIHDGRRQLDIKAQGRADA
jgi:hypothetical protein